MKKYVLIASFWVWSISVAFATEKFEDRMLNLGVDEDFTAMERGHIKDQVKNFIPPLLIPAVGGHAYVLPPGLFNFSTNFKFVNVDEDDWAGDPNNIHRENQVQRRFITSSLKYGFDLDRKYFHSFTAVLNLTYESSVNRGPVRLPDVGNNAKSVYNTGTSEGLQDINIMLKKKIWDQGNNLLVGQLQLVFIFQQDNMTQRQVMMVLSLLKMILLEQLPNLHLRGLLILVNYQLVDN